MPCTAHEPFAPRGRAHYWALGGRRLAQGIPPSPLPQSGVLGMKYKAQERAWVQRLLARLTPTQRARYELACREAPRHPHSGKLYDGEKAQIAERILYEDVKRNA